MTMPPIAAFCVISLTHGKCEVETAANGEEALEMLKAAAAAGFRTKLALLDVQMPKMDGWTLARAIQADPALAGTRLIVLTSFGQTFSPAELKAAGIEAYLVKPVKQSRLFDCVVGAIDKAEAENGGSSRPHPSRGDLLEAKSVFAGGAFSWQRVMQSSRAKMVHSTLFELLFLALRREPTSPRNDKPKVVAGVGFEPTTFRL